MTNKQVSDKIFDALDDVLPADIVAVVVWGRVEPIPDNTDNVRLIGPHIVANVQDETVIHTMLQQAARNVHMKTQSGDLN